MAAPKNVSFKRDNFVAGGFGLEDGTYLMKKHTAVMFDYGGKSQAGASPALKVDAVPVTIDSKGGFTETGEAQEQHYSFGNAEAWGVNKAGTGFVALGEKTQPSASSNFFMYTKGMEDSGFPADDFDDDVSAFDGTIVVITNVPAPKRAGLKSNLTEGAAPPRADKTIPVPSDVLKLPGDKKCRVGGVSAKQSTKEKEAAPSTKGKKDKEEDQEGGDAKSVLKAHLTTMLEGETKVDRSKGRVTLFRSMNEAKVEVEVRDAAMAIYKDNDELGEVLMEVGDGFTVKGSDIVAV